VYFVSFQCWKGYGEDVWYWTETSGEGRHDLLNIAVKME